MFKHALHATPPIFSKYDSEGCTSGKNTEDKKSHLNLFCCSSFALRINVGLAGLQDIISYS